MKRQWFFVCVAWLSVLVTAAANAQPSADSSGTAPIAGSAGSLLRGGALGELLFSYVPREAPEIERLLGDAQAMQRAADREVDTVRRLATEADGRARITKEEIETTKVRLDIAKKAKDAAARAELEATSKRQSRERDYFEKLRDALRADADRLEAEREASSARVKALEKERDVAGQYAQVSAAAPGPEAMIRYRALLRDMLEAQKKSANLWIDASKKRERVADRRLKQLESHSKLSE